MIPTPAIPDTVIRFIGQRAPRIDPAAGDTVAIPLWHDWGPVAADNPGASLVEGGVQLVDDFESWVQIFGDSDTPGRTAVAGAFAGRGLPGQPGAGGVVVARMAGSGAAKATHTIQDRTPTPALRLDGRYIGTRGNRLTYEIDTDPSNPTVNDRLRIRLDNVVIESYVFAQTDVIGLTAQINSRSAVVVATNLEVAPTRLAANVGTPVALTGGNDGSTLTGTDHLNALATLQLKSFLFGILAPFDLTDSSILASYVSWTQAQDDASRSTRLVVGGAAGESVSAAITRSSACGNSHVVNVGGGTWHDDLLGKDLSTSQLAPRIAGILAAAGDSHAITAANIGGIHAVGNTAPSVSDVTAAVANGVVTFLPADSPDADIRIAKGVTTYTADSPTAPQQIFGDPRLVGIMDSYKRAMRQWGNKNVIGDKPVNDDSRNAVYGEARRLQDDLLQAGLILPGDGVLIPKPWVQVQNTDADPARRDTIPYTFGWQFARTSNAVLGEGHVV